VAAIGAGAGCHAYPKRHGVGGVGRDRSDPGEKQGRESDEAAAPRDRVQGAAESAGKEQEDDSLDGQTSSLSHSVDKERGVNERARGRMRLELEVVVRRGQQLPLNRPIHYLRRK